jgi:hypothetical protein
LNLFCRPILLQHQPHQSPTALHRTSTAALRIVAALRSLLSALIGFDLPLIADRNATGSRFLWKVALSARASYFFNIALVATTSSRDVKHTATLLQAKTTTQLTWRSCVPACCGTTVLAQSVQVESGQGCR